MKEDEIELFHPGEKVWTKILVGEYAAFSLMMRHGIGTGPFHVHAVMEADLETHQRSLHPQLVFLVDDEGDPVDVYGLEGSLSAFWFTKKDLSGLFEEEFTTTEQEELSGYVERAQYALRDTLREAGKLQDIIAAAKEKGYFLGFTLFTQVAREDADDEKESPGVVVQTGMVTPVEFTPKDEKDFFELFKPKPSDKK